MKKRISIGITLSLITLVFGLKTTPASAANLMIPVAGRVSIELITSEAQFSNTMSVISPVAGIAATGCNLEPAVGLTGVHVVSEKISQRGCRVELDSDPATDGIQGFAANTTFEFGMCAQTDADDDCEFTWSSNPSNNSDGFDHVQTTTIAPGVFQLAWEDLENGGDLDFDDLIVVVRVQSDADGDGLWDDWEQNGIDTNGDGVVDFTLTDANPNRKDIYLEIDYLDCSVTGGDCAAGDTHSHIPDSDAVTAVINAFANAPVNNPDGSTGITLHVDIDDAIAHQNFLALGCGFGNSFDTVKADPAFFGPNNPRRFTHHYAIFAHQQASTTTSSGCGELPGNDFIVTLGGWTDDIGTPQQQAGTLMHEFGHNLNLRHGGDVNTNRKPNYLSIMSYAFQTAGIAPTDPDGTGPLTARVDFSSEDLPDLDENNLNETTGIGDGTDNTRYFCPPGGGQNVGAGTGAIDWNCDGDGGTDTSVAVDINGDGTSGVLTGYDDWDNLKYDFQNTSDFEDGAHNTTTEIEIDLPTHLEIPQGIEIDIKPSGIPNSINTKGNGVVPVAICNGGFVQNSINIDDPSNPNGYSNASTNVNINSIRFALGADGEPKHNLADLGVLGDHLTEFIDTNDDTVPDTLVRVDALNCPDDPIGPDLVVHIPIRDTGLESGDIEACLTAELTDGTKIVGCDSVQIVK